ncbi:MAG: hypothetical protein KAI86_15555 [Desulfobacterales bacterium]|nr:hypothetical protein [Desulfobacterales bacterium]
MKRLYKMTVSLALGLICLLFITSGCYNGRVIIEKNPPHPSPPPGPHVEKGPPPWAPAHGYRAKHHYRYYPSWHVYFDVGRSLYFYYDSGHWRVSVSLPSGIRIEVEDYVTLEMETDRPYEYHAEVAKRYPPGQQKKMYKGNGKKKKW